MIGPEARASYDAIAIWGCLLSCLASSSQLSQELKASDSNAFLYNHLLDRSQALFTSPFSH